MEGEKEGLQWEEGRWWRSGLLVGGSYQLNSTRSIRCRIYWRMHEEGDSGEMGYMVKVAELGM